VAEINKTIQLKQTSNEDVIHYFPVTRWDSVENKPSLSTNNILHNWDFTNPVNSRGLTTYANIYGYTIDRWACFTTNNGSLQLNGVDGITLNFPDAYNQFLQFIENPHIYLGLTLTASVDIGGNIYSVTGTMPNQMPTSGNVDVANLNIPVTQSRLRVHIDSANDGALRCGIMGTATNEVVGGVRRMKLELGSVSTLATDPPMDFGRELAICQRYQLDIRGRRVRAYLIYPDAIHFALSLPTTLRITPTLIGYPSVYTTNTINGLQSGFSFNISSPVNSAGQVVITASKTAHGLTDAMMIFDSVNLAMLDANL